MPDYRPRDAKPYLLRIYREDHQILFVLDGNSPIISSSVKRVRGVSDEFKNFVYIRKTLNILDDSAHNRQRLVQEAKILHVAYYHYVVRLVHTYFYKADGDKTIFTVVIDYADGSLDKYLRRGKTPLEQWFGCLIDVVRHIHGLDIRYRDIKLTNILIKGGMVLLADFGISQIGLGKTMPTTFPTRSPSRTREYYVPEVDRRSTRSCSTDIFSLRAVFLEIFIALYYPDQIQSLDRVLRPIPQSPSSYA